VQHFLTEKLRKAPLFGLHPWEKMLQRTKVLSATGYANVSSSDLLSMQRTTMDGYEPGGWTLKLNALSSDDPQRLVRFLSGVLLACGGWILTRSTQGNELAEIDFEFARAACVEIYAALITSGLELSRDSHRQLAELCHCTQNLLESKAFDVARIDLVVYSNRLPLARGEEEPAVAG
jgi:hypothetical protein